MSGASITDLALAKVGKQVARRIEAARKTDAAEPAAVRLIRGDAVALEPVRWLWPGFLPAAMLTILGGAPGCGKTTIALSLAAIVTSGGTWPGGSARNAPGDVVIWSGEDGHAVLAARLVAMGADMRRVHFIDGITGSEGEAFDPGRDMPMLEATAERLAAPRLLILDPIVSAVAGDSHKGAEVRRSLQPVVALAQRLGCAVVGITHFSKGTAGRDPAERITGSIAFAALARLVLVAAKVKADDGEPRRVLVRAKSNIGPDDGGFAYSLDRVEVAPDVEGQRVVWLEALEGSARDVLAEAEADPEDCAASESDEAMQYLRDVLKGADATPSRDASRRMKAEGFSDKVIRRAREKLGVLVKREGFGKDMRSVWSLPVLPTSAQSCPVPPTKTEGSYGQECDQTGTNAGQADDCEVL